MYVAISTFVGHSDLQALHARQRSSDSLTAIHGLTRFSLAGKVAVVTGSTRGIGRAIAEALADAGAAVTVVGRDAAAAAQVALAIEAAGGASFGMGADVRRPADIERLIGTTLERLGRLDILVNNAAVSPYYKRAEQVSEAEWDEVISVNLKGTFLCAQAAGRVMIAQSSGGIINVSSVGGRVALPNLSAYCAAKGGVEQLTRVLAVEWARHGVRVNAIAPAYVETDLTTGLRAHSRLLAGLIDQTPLGRLAAPTEVAGAAVYLASDSASYVTGQTLYVDGGWTAM